jgi:catalase (peroxidase I)
MKRKEFMQFGKKTDNSYKIIERKFKDNNVYFFVEITNTFDLQCFDMKFPETYIFEETFKSYDDALECVNKLKEEDKKITVLEEKIHTL